MRRRGELPGARESRGHQPPAAVDRQVLVPATAHRRCRRPGRAQQMDHFEDHFPLELNPMIEPTTNTETTAPGPILVIDDEPYILRSLSYLLQREGYQVETASNGEEGLQRVRSLRPPLVFLDIMMPHMNGYEVCEQVKQDPSLEGTYVIMLSAKGQPIDRERGLLGGADEYMTKPFSPREVAQRVRSILADRAAKAAA